MILNQKLHKPIDFLILINFQCYEVEILIELYFDYLMIELKLNKKKLYFNILIFTY